VRRRQQGHQEYGNHILREEGPIYIIAPELPEE